MIRGTKNFVVKILNATTGDQETIKGKIIATDRMMHQAIGDQEMIDAGKTDIKGKGIATIAPTPNEGMIRDIAHKGHHRHRAMMRPEAIRQQCRSGACLRKLMVTYDIVTPNYKRA